MKIIQAALRCAHLMNLPTSLKSQKLFATSTTPTLPAGAMKTKSSPKLVTTTMPKPANFTGKSSAIKSERTRMQEIINHGIATNCTSSACYFAFNTDLPAAQAIDAIKVCIADGGAAGRQRMYVAPAATVPIDPTATAQAVIAAGAMRRGK